jgi:hypothetical protein
MNSTLAKLWRFAWLSFAFGTLLALVYAAHVRWLRVDVVLYSALLDGALVLGIATLMAWRGPWFKPFNIFERVQMLLAWGLLAFLFAFAVPTVIDRSLSFYILEKLQQHGGALREDRFEDLFTRGYAREHHLVDVRLTEQLASGTVAIDGPCVRLTPRGEHLASFSRWFRHNLLPRKRLLMGRYTDVLTDPFRAGVVATDDACHASAGALK